MSGRQALSASARSDWADPSTAPEKVASFLRDRYLLGCPCPKVSAVGESAAFLYPGATNLASSHLGEIERLVGDVVTVPDAGTLGNKLVRASRAGNKMPKGTSEFACYVVRPPGVLKDGYGLFPDKRAKELSAEERRSFEALLRVDAFYRHIRNALAHGAYRVARRKVNGHMLHFVYLQDANPKGHITARMLLSVGTLEELASMR